MATKFSRATSPQSLSKRSVLAVVVGSFALSACMSGGSNLRPLTPVPTTPVSATSLPQPIVTQQNQTLNEAVGFNPDGTPILPGDTAVETTPLPGLETATLTPTVPEGAGEVSEDDLIGAWSASTPLATCSLNLSLTTWQGGFRASTRNCGDAQLATLGAWSVEGQQVMLKSADGATLARLFRTGPTRYVGQLESGGAVTVFR